jgi:hypothetical protein
VEGDSSASDAGVVVSVLAAVSVLTAVAALSVLAAMAAVALYVLPEVTTTGRDHKMDQRQEGVLTIQLDLELFLHT